MAVGPGTRLGKYEVIAPLGAGGMGTVYRATDTTLGRQVAIKVLSESLGSDRSRLDRFGQEARTLAALNHPNIATVHGVEETATIPAIVMELVEGRTLREFLGERQSVHDLSSVGSQAAKALGAAHARGIVHRDIKPENIMLRPDGYVKVLDFGLARLAEVPDEQAETKTRLTGAGSIVGTVRYMSPEQIQDLAVGPASDIFSLGIVLYELATLTHPFAASSGLGVASAILSDKPIPPSHLNPDLPASTDALILEMLDKKPEHRPRATDVAARLEQRSGPVARPAMSGAAVPPIVGRQAQLEELRTSLETVMDGPAGIVHAISADGGFGKTTLVNHFLDTLAHTHRCRIGRGRCSERLAGAEAYLPLLEAFDGMIRDETGDHVSRAMKELAPSWYAQLRPGAFGSAQTHALATGSWEQMKRQLHALVEQLTHARPVVLFLDDVHWADASTIELILYLCDRLDSLRMMLLMAYRPGELLGTAHPYSELRSNLRVRGLYRETPLAQFNRQEIEHYVATAYADNAFTEEFVSLLHEQTEGAPLFLVHLMRQLVEQGAVAQINGTWQVQRRIQDLQPAIPASVSSLIKRTVEQLGDEERTVLVAASIQGYEFDSAVTGAALARNIEEIEERLDRVERAHALIRFVEERELAGRTPSLRYAFTHHYYQAAFRDTARASRRQRLSAATAAALVSYYGSDGGMASRIADLYEAAGDANEAARHYLAAARHAAGMFAVKGTVLLAQRGLRLLMTLPEGQERDRIELQLQTALGAALTSFSGYAAPDVEKAYSRARVLCDRLGDSKALFNALYGIYRYYHVRGRLRIGQGVIQQLIALADDQDDAMRRTVAYSAMATALLQLGELEDALRHSTIARDGYDRSWQPALRAVNGADIGLSDLLWRSLTLWLLGRIGEATEAHDAAVTMAGRDAVPFELAYTHTLSAWFHQCRGEIALVRELSESAIQVSRQHDFAIWLAVAAVFRAWSIAASGDTAEGIQGLQQSVDRFQRTGGELNLPYFIGLLADAHRLAGDARAGLAAVDLGLRYADANEDRCWEPELHRLKGEFLMQAGRAHSPAAEASAEASLRSAVAIGERQGSWSLGLRAAVSLARLLAAQHRDDEQRALLSEQILRFPENLHTPDLDAARALLNASGGG